MSFLKNVFRKSATPTGDGRAASRPAERLAVSAPARKARPVPSTALVLLRKLVTEKATQLQRGNQYTFAVAKAATKGTIAQAFRQRYGVMPHAVRVANVKSRQVRFGKTFGQTKRWKKAIITLPSGVKIDAEKLA